MKFHIDFDAKHFESSDLKIVGAFEKTDKDDKKTYQLQWTSKDLANHFKGLKSAATYTGGKGSMMTFNGLDGETVLVVGMGEKKKAKNEEIRRAIANATKYFQPKKFQTVSIDAASFNAISKLADATGLIVEAYQMTAYKFDKYLSNTSKPSFKEVCIYVVDKKIKKSVEKIVAHTTNVIDSVNICRDFINEAPNVLHSVEYAKRVEKDVKANLKGVKVKVLGKSDLKKENMNLFLAVNAGSAHEPRLVHLTYTPKKVTKNTKHYALVGKGLTFDTGGYSLKPGGAMMGMKFDMGGSATVYAAFRAAVLNNSPYKLTCILGMTDNAVNEHATFPDSIVKGRNGKTVEILNTDAEGRLVLADCLDYAGDQKPDYIIDAATLTGACLVALGSQVCAVLGNDDKFINNVKKSADNQDEYMWQLPIIPEWRDDMKAKIADLKNIGTPARAGTATAAAFLENFIQDGISWAHLDVAGIAGDQAHLPYCPAKGGSGLVVRSLHHLLTNSK